MMRIMSYKFVIDSYAWVEYLLGSTAGKFVDFLLKNASCITPSIVIAELSDKFHREKNLKEWQILCKFIKHKTEIISLDAILADHSGKCKNFLRRQQLPNERKVGLADAIIYQTSISQDSRLVTGDEHFESSKSVVYLKNRKAVEKIRTDITKNLLKM